MRLNYTIQIPMKVKKLREEARPLAYAHQGDSGLDVFACSIKRLNKEKKPEELLDDMIASTWIIQPGETVLLCTGWAVSVPEGAEVQARPTSGNGLKTKMRIPNAPGTIDSIYRGEVGIELENTGKEPFELKRQAKVAQLVVCPVFEAIIEEVEELDETDRGAEGYGSTGTMNSTTKSDK